MVHYCPEGLHCNLNDGSVSEIVNCKSLTNGNRHEILTSVVQTSCFTLTLHIYYYLRFQNVLMCQKKASEIYPTSKEKLFWTPCTQHAISKTSKYRPCQPSLIITFPKWGMRKMLLLTSLCQTCRATTLLQTFVKHTASDHNCYSRLHEWLKYFQLCHNCDFTFRFRLSKQLLAHKHSSPAHTHISDEY